MADFTNTHRYFIQYMLKHGIATINNAMEYCRHVSRGEINDQSEFKDFVLDVNREIKKNSFNLTFKTCEVTKEKFLVWQTLKNDISLLQIKFSAVDIEYFHSVFQEILRNEEHRIKQNEALNLSSSLTSRLSLENAEKLLKTFVQIGYFVSKDSCIFLGPRLILEFTSYLQSHFTDSICPLCSELVFWGKSCRSCEKTAHIYCLETYLRNQKDCPNCHVAWSTPMEVEENGGSDSDSSTD
ncbi:unnamed protein product [Phyllotreta striolata]|uniref:Non-structural maintenance of chromosomes element 1 homolog n=1 Tax=Phyllotreta striolata TaxID=444603 RepID=A0A9N9XRG4_PHYSR|nr:unnamed protein product [Phyllotreta striolata]